MILFQHGRGLGFGLGLLGFFPSLCGDMSQFNTAN